MSSYAAGWYPDTNYPGYERYYDGAAWTEHTRPTAAVSAQVTRVVPEVAPSSSGIVDSVPTVATLPHGYASPDPQPYTQATYGQSAAPVYGNGPTTVGAEPPKKKSKKGLIVAGSIVGGIIIVAVLGNAIGGGGDKNEPVADEPAVVQEEEVEPATEPDEPAENAPVEEEPAAEPPAPTADGSVESPYPSPYTATKLFGGEKYALNARVVNADANAAVNEHNMFNSEAPAGFKYVLVEATMTGKDPDGVEPKYEQYDIQLATAEGNPYESEYVTFAEGTASFYDGPTLYPEQSFTGLIAYIVPADATSFLIKVGSDYVVPAA